MACSLLQKLDAAKLQKKNPLPMKNLNNLTGAGEFSIKRGEFYPVPRFGGTLYEQ